MLNLLQTDDIKVTHLWKRKKSFNLWCVLSCCWSIDWLWARSMQSITLNETHFYALWPTRNQVLPIEKHIFNKTNKNAHKQKNTKLTTLKNNTHTHTHTFLLKSWINKSQRNYQRVFAMRIMERKKVTKCQCSSFICEWESNSFSHKTRDLLKK